MICHDEYPQSHYKEGSNPELDGWAFVNIYYTRQSLFKVDLVQSPMICKDCFDGIDFAHLPQQIEDFKLWMGQRSSEYDSQKEVWIEVLKC